MPVASASVGSDGATVSLRLGSPHLADRIYEVRTTIPGADPAVAYYTMNRVPRSKGASVESKIESP